VAPIVTPGLLLIAPQTARWVMIGTYLLSDLPEYCEDAADAASSGQRRSGIDGNDLVTALQVAAELGEGALLIAAQAERRQKKLLVDEQGVGVADAWLVVAAQVGNSDDMKAPRF